MKTLPLAVLFGLALAAGADVRTPNIIVIYTDDHGWADLGAQGIRKDIRTPNLDALAAGGLRATEGYVTAPQCVPSRAGLLSGRHQNRFGVESNGEPLAGFDAQNTIAERLQRAGYATGMAGKWHLGPANQITGHGFDQVFYKHSNGPGYWNMDLAGRDIPPTDQKGGGYHLDLISEFACAFIKRHHERPFFFYLAPRAPHTPLDAPEKYTARFPGELPGRRRQALAMISAIDDGVGRILATLREHGLEERTLIFFMGDNGAPLKIHQIDSPLDGDAGGWDGSLNAPMNGEKGMLSEGGIRVPWLAYWKGVIPGGQVYRHPVISLDVAATAAALASIPTMPGELDGVNLIPHFTGANPAPPHDIITWRWIAQSAIREGRWKYLRGGQRDYLFDLEADREEKHDLLSAHPDIAKRLRGRLESWAAELQPPGLATKPMATTWEQYFDHYLDGKLIAPPATAKASSKATSTTVGDWIVRNGTLAVEDGTLRVIGDKGGRQRPFIACAKLKIPGPATAVVTIRNEQGGPAGFAWRLDGQKDFTAEQTVVFEVKGSSNWQEHKVELPATGSIIHLRVLLPGGTSDVRHLELKPAHGGPAMKWAF